MQASTKELMAELRLLLSKVDTPTYLDTGAPYENYVLAEFVAGLKISLSAMEKTDRIQQDVDMILRITPAYSTESAIRQSLFFHRKPDIIKKARSKD